MVYPSDFEAKTGFSNIRKQIKDKCSYADGKTWCDEMKFSSNYDVVKTRLMQTWEMMQAYSEVERLTIQVVSDISSEIEALKLPGGYLEPKALRHLRATLLSAEIINKFFSKKTSEEGEEFLYPFMHKALKSMSSFPLVIREIDAVVSEQSTVKDSASPELSEIRRSLHSVSSSMSGIMRRVIEKGINGGILDRDTTPTMREGRLMLPVPSGLKRGIQGIVVDESATGKTVFIEPLEIVEANNKIRNLQLEERKEIIRLMVILADKIRPYLNDIHTTIKLLGLFDFIMAKALLARKHNASLPTLHRSPVIEWYHAVHPVLQSSLEEQGREVVPLNITLNNKNRILVISGPNAGGKSVTLKTVGIIQYMIQCGILPTVYSNSHIGIFDNLMLDIGDEQSIEDDLSTYSSHLRNMKEFLNNASPRSLFLIDEMGSGTEPHFGGALARSILDALNRKNTFGIVTTHYQELKSFAEVSQGVVNGAMLYDRQKMRPLFQLSIGSPGSSFALEIARNTGLPKEIIDNAKEIVGADYVEADKYMLDIARDRKYWSNKRLSIKEKEHKLSQILESYENSAEELRAKKALIIAEARKEAQEILRNSNAVLEKTILEIRKSQAEKERTKALRKELEEYKEQLAEDKSDISLPEIKRLKRPSIKKDKKNKTLPTEKGKESIESLQVGSNVTMKDGNSVGTILELEGSKATVAFGTLKTIVPLDKLKPTLRKDSSMRSSSFVPTSGNNSSDSRNRQLNFSRELDVRGMRVDEALQAVTYFLDDAVQFEADRVRILHGTGTGALRMSIRQLLQSYPAVISFRDEDVRFGGAGITVVNLT